MSYHKRQLIIFGIVCLTKDIYPVYGEQKQCKDRMNDTNFTTFKWDKSMSSREYQESYCPLRCFNGTLVSIHNLDSKCPKLNCFDCSCKRPECEHYGICCPDISVTYHELPGVESTFSQVGMDVFYIKDKQFMSESANDASFNTTSTHYGRKTPILGCHELDFEQGFLYIRSCPSDFTGHLDTVRLCEEDVPASQITFDDYAWAIDNDTNVVYRNVHCATCNGAVKPYQVPLILHFKDGMCVYDASDLNEMLRSALDPAKCSCVVYSDFPADMITFVCDPKLFDNGVVSSCNGSHPADLIQACADSNENYHRMFSRFTQRYYKNIFCAICNTRSYPAYSAADTCDCLPKERHPPYDWFPSFSMLINMGQNSNSKETKGNSTPMDKMMTCPKSDWSSPDGGCLPLKCSRGKELVNGNCRTAIAEVKGLQYRFSLWMRPSFNGSRSGWKVERTLKEITKHLLQKLKKVMANISDDYQFEGFCLHDSQNDRHTNKTRDLKIVCGLKGVVVASSTMSRDEFEFQANKDLPSAGVNIEADQENSVSYSSLVSLDDYVRDWYNRTDQFTLEVIEDKKWSATRRTRERSIEISGLLNCPYVSLGPSYYNVTVVYTYEVIPSVNVTVDLNVTTLSISDWADLNMLEVDEGGILNVCHQVLDSRLQQMGQYRRNYLPEVTNERDAITFAQYVTTLVCLACSVICLVLSLVTYLRFPVLQTSAGQNNVCLCLSLLLAQAALIAASHRPRPVGLCKAVGLLTHFLWLWMFAWTFICSFHMFKVFTAKTRSTSCSERDGRKQLIKRIACSLTGPVIIVLSVVVGSLISSDGETIGYGQDACYLDTVWLIGVSMVAPLTAVLICNMAFFAVTVRTIHNTRRLQTSECTKSDDLNQICVYVKLSSITGACWAATIIAEAADVDVLRFISIFLNGFQGVFIFLSYICNKRVLNLYMPRTAALTSSRSETNSIVVERCLPCVQSCVQSKEHNLQKTNSTDIG